PRPVSNWKDQKYGNSKLLVSLVLALTCDVSHVALPALLTLPPSFPSLQRTATTTMAGATTATVTVATSQPIKCSPEPGPMLLATASRLLCGTMIPSR